MPDETGELVHHHSGVATFKIPRDEGVYGEQLLAPAKNVLLLGLVDVNTYCVVWWMLNKVFTLTVPCVSL